MNQIVHSCLTSKIVPADHETDSDLLVSDPRLFQRFERDIEIAGLVGEQKNAKIVFLAAVSAMLAKPLNVSVTGESSAGKNHLTGTVANFIPDDKKKMLSGMSPKALMHSAEDEYEHKAVFIAEYEGISGADYAIRTFQSEQVIEWEYVESSNSGLQKKKHKVRGPAAFIQATTRVTLHPENETRLLFIRIDESKEQTTAINQRQAEEAANGRAKHPQGLFARWHQFLGGLSCEKVRILFAPQLAVHFPSDSVRSRRDFPKLLGLIEVLAYLNQRRRARDNEGAIIAAPEDYLDAKELFEHCYFAGPETAVREMLAALQGVSKDVSMAEIMSKTGWKKSKAYEVLSRAEELGCIVEAERRGRYNLLREHPEVPLSLPDKVRLTADDFRISTGLPN